MIEFLRTATTTQFIALLVFVIAAVMVLLQIVVRRSVWSGYLIALFVSFVVLAVTLR